MKEEISVTDVVKRLRSLVQNLKMDELKISQKVNAKTDDWERGFDYGLSMGLSNSINDLENLIWTLV